MISVLCLLMGQTALARDAVKLRADLQGAMQRHLDRSAIDGAFPHLNFDTGEVERLFTTEAHPIILTMGEIFILCADLRTVGGERRIADFYLAEVAGRYRVIRTEIENRGPLEALTRAGRTKRLK